MYIYVCMCVYVYIYIYIDVCLLVLSELLVGATTIGTLATYAGQDFANTCISICVYRYRYRCR